MNVKFYSWDFIDSNGVNISIPPQENDRPITSRGEAKGFMLEHSHVFKKYLNQQEWYHIDIVERDIDMNITFAWRFEVRKVGRTLQYSERKDYLPVYSKDE